MPNIQWYSKSSNEFNFDIHTIGTGASSEGAKRPGREADHSPPTSGGVKKTWIYTSTTPYVFMAQWLINYALKQFNLFI
jgi:hypothetical protein